MKRNFIVNKAIVIILICLPLFLSVKGCNPIGPSTEPSIVGEWLIDQTYESYFDAPPDTVFLTQYVTTIYNDDGTFTTSGTTQWEFQAQSATLEGDGTYTYDEVAGTLEMIHLNTLVGGASMAVPPTTYNCEITASTMTLTYPTEEAYKPAEPMIYTRQ